MQTMEEFITETEATYNGRGSRDTSDEWRQLIEEAQRRFGQSAPVVLVALAEGAKVNRCDLCQRYPSDEAALEKLRQLDLVPSKAK
jgi:hypothetical protein